MNLLTVESEQMVPATNKEKTFSELILEHPISNLISPPATWKIRPWDIDLLNMLQELCLLNFECAYPADNITPE